MDGIPHVLTRTDQCSEHHEYGGRVLSARKKKARVGFVDSQFVQSR